jgi:hypothetical protein
MNGHEVGAQPEAEFTQCLLGPSGPEPARWGEAVRGQARVVERGGRGDETQSRFVCRQRGELGPPAEVEPMRRGDAMVVAVQQQAVAPPSTACSPEGANNRVSGTLR